MPPEITAGPMALAGSPPGAAAGVKPAEPPPDSVLSSTLFASLLAQSRLPEPPGRTAKAAGPGLAASPARRPALPALENAKTMDTLPKLWLLPKTAAKAKAGELLSSHALAPNEPAYRTPADDKAAPASPGAPANTPDPAPASAWPTAAAAPLPMLSAAPAPQGTALVPQGTALVPQAEAATTAPSKSVAPNSQPALPAPAALSAKFSLELLPSPLPALLPTLNQAGAQRTDLTQPAGHPRTNQPQIGLTQPRFSQSGPAQPSNLAAPQAKNLALPNASTPALPNASTPALPNASTPALPNASTPALPNASTPALTASSAASAAALSVIIPAAAFGVLAPPMCGDPALPGAALPKPAPKSASVSLKPAAENADTITRTLPVETAAASAKIVEPAAAPAPVAEAQAASQEAMTLAKTLNPKKTEEHDAALKTAAPVEIQASAPAMQAAGPNFKPLSAADHAAMVRQVADGVGAMPLPARPGAAQQMSLQLHPKDWGSLQISVSVTAGPDAGSAKTVTTHIVAETPQVKAALQSQTPALHQALRASGLSLEHLTVSVKPAPETAMPETMKPASPSASDRFSPAGFLSGQGQADGGISQTQAGPQAGQPSGAAASGNMASGGGSQNARQGQTPPAFAPAAAPAEPDEIVVERLPMRPILGRIDTLA